MYAVHILPLVYSYLKAITVYAICVYIVYLFAHPVCYVYTSINQVKYNLWLQSREAIFNKTFMSNKPIEVIYQTSCINLKKSDIFNFLAGSFPFIISVF